MRSEPLSHAECVVRIIEQRGAIDPLLEAPCVRTAIFKMDWLHASDQGISADFVGNVFKQLVQHMPGDTKEEQYNALYLQLKAWYDEFGIEDRMDAIKPSFVEHRQGHKLRTSAAKLRALVPFVARLCDELCDPDDPVEDAMHKAAHHLANCYDALSSSCDDNTAQLATNGLKFARQYIALHDHLTHDDDELFRLKPKLHFFLHLCLDGGDPAKHWCYRDEGFGGTVAKIAHRRGGIATPTATSEQVVKGLALGTPRISIR